MINWLIDFSLFSAVLLLIYMVIFRNKSFYSYNRMLLLLIPLLSILIPLVSTYFENTIYHQTGFTFNLLPIEIRPDPDFTVKSEATAYLSTGFWWLLYLGGVVFSALYFLIGWRRAVNIIRKARKVSCSEYTYLISPNAPGPFSLFNHIVIPEKAEKREELFVLLKHEKTHSQMGHSYDNIYYNILATIFWFNPFIHLLGRELRQVHECQADDAAIKESSREVYSRMLLESVFGTDLNLLVTTGMASPFFNSSLVKTRITMLYKKQSPGWLRYTYLLFLPIIAALSLHSCEKNDMQQEDNSKKVALTLNDISHPPQFDHCKGTSIKEEQIKCFWQGLSLHMKEELKYPQLARDQKLEGRLYVQFTINERGKVEDTRILRSINLPEDSSQPMLEAKEALEVHSRNVLASLPELKPAEIDGKPVSLQLVAPINYKLQ